MTALRVAAEIFFGLLALDIVAVGLFGLVRRRRETERQIAELQEANLALAIALLMTLQVPVRP